ncbi:hypothetical protein FHR92_000952 [Fontibacillus solani]|uniref:Uncharacterized protein n=1 Tax=Fontibacillus solani TaxID=1572857 RepID=A0A7W3SQP4_9BACL|nr:hypothetical protein [Fontibacillus solani]
MVKRRRIRSHHIAAPGQSIFRNRARRQKRFDRNDDNWF